MRGHPKALVFIKAIQKQVTNEIKYMLKKKSKKVHSYLTPLAKEEHIEIL